MADDYGKSAKRGDAKLLQEAKERFQQAIEAEHENRDAARSDLEFLVGDQWDARAKSERENDNRPCLTINRMPQFVRQVVNDARQNRPGIKIHPVDGGADTDTAEVLQGMVRHIETRSSADVAYDTGIWNAVANGFGYWRVITEYAHDRTFEQELRIQRIRNPFTVYMDPEAQEPDASDAYWAFVTSRMAKDEFRKEYPNKEPVSLDVSGIGDDDRDWYGKETVRVAEYWCIKSTPVTVVSLTDGSVVDDDERPDAATYKVDNDPMVVESRQITRYRVHWYLLSGTDVLDERSWPGRYLPIVRVIGDEADINGKQHLRSLIRDAKDPQRMYNFWSSAETEYVNLSPISPFVGTAEQFENFEHMWAASNRKPRGYLPYNADPQAPGPPTRTPPPSASNGIMQAKLAVADDMKAVTGIYDAALGQRSNETSGVAIRQRQMEGDTSTYHFIDNLSRSIRHTGRILIDLIPHIYDTDRFVRLMWEDGESEQAMIVPGKAQRDREELQELERTVGRLADPTVGRYDVTVSVGPSYQTRRQEAAESMMQFIQAYPQAATVAGDLIAKAMDWPGSDEIAERLKKMLPPGLADDSEQPMQQPPDPEAIKAQQQAQIDQFKAQTERWEAQKEHERKMLEMQIDAEVKLATARIQAGTQVETAEMKALADLEKQRQQMDGNLQVEDIRARQRDNAQGMQEATRERTARMQAQQRSSPGRMPNGAGGSRESQ